jgi:hypothetical protein
MSKFNLFSRFHRYDIPPEVGVKKKKITDKERYSIKGFFTAYKSHFWKLAVVNMVYFLLNTPRCFSG